MPTRRMFPGAAAAAAKKIRLTRPELPTLEVLSIPQEVAEDDGAAHVPLSPACPVVCESSGRDRQP
jgi:hypothetical protein